MSQEKLVFKKIQWSTQPPEVLSWGGFLGLSRRKIRNLYQNGQASQWYEVETCHPPFVDAVVLLLHGPGPVVALRKSLRPAACLVPHDPAAPPLHTDDGDGALWELPAGGVEPPDLEPGGMGMEGRARQEAWEEAGLRLKPGELKPLGPALFSAPAFCPERLFYFVARVDPQQCQEPPGDGHPMEQGALLRFVPLDEALSWCRQGLVGDTKSEVGLRRLAEHLESAGVV